MGPLRTSCRDGEQYFSVPDPDCLRPRSGLFQTRTEPPRKGPGASRPPFLYTVAAREITTPPLAPTTQPPPSPRGSDHHLGGSPRPPNPRGSVPDSQTHADRDSLPAFGMKCLAKDRLNSASYANFRLTLMGKQLSLPEVARKCGENIAPVARSWRVCFACSTRRILFPQQKSP